MHRPLVGELLQLRCPGFAPRSYAAPLLAEPPRQVLARVEAARRSPGAE
ncbi:hypothetical protein FM112_05640 [Gulosibacter sp. 10]|nr:hypothetical protein FM112_05640 [Gulosibacter sp. 10]